MNTKTISVVITRAKETGYSRGGEIEISRDLECHPPKWFVKITPPTIGKCHFSDIWVVKSKKTLTKNAHTITFD